MVLKSIRLIFIHILAIPHPITGFTDESAYVTTKTADRNQSIAEDG